MISLPAFCHDDCIRIATLALFTSDARIIKLYSGVPYTLRSSGTLDTTMSNVPLTNSDIAGPQRKGASAGVLIIQKQNLIQLCRSSNRKKLFESWRLQVCGGVLTPTPLATFSGKLILSQSAQ